MINLKAAAKNKGAEAMIRKVRDRVLNLQPVSLADSVAKKYQTSLKITFFVGSIRL